MTRLLIMVLAFEFLCMASLAIAQQSDRPTAQIGNARCAYVPSSSACAPQPADAAGRVSTVATQFPRRTAGPHAYPVPPRSMHMARSMPAPNLKGVLIGGLIGFALGAARTGDPSARARVGAGFLVGGIGAVIGGAIGAAPGRYRYRRASWPDDDEIASAKPGSTESVRGPSGAATLTESTPKIVWDEASQGTGTGQPASDK